MVARRAGGEPLEQVVGWAEFAGLRVFVDPGVFVPRRRSEFLVEVAGLLAGRQGSTVPRVVVDLCCGTGALGLAVAVKLARAEEAVQTVEGPQTVDVARTIEAPQTGEAAQTGDVARMVHAAGAAGEAERDADWAAAADVRLGGVELHAADLDPAAVACARRNVSPAGGRVYAGDLFTALPDSLRGRIGVLICNAPYVPTTEIAFMPAEARDHEALMALDGGADGLAILRRAAAEAGAWLAPGGVLLVETSERQATAMAAVMTAAGLAAQVHEDDESGATVVTGVTAGDLASSSTEDDGSLRGL
jgi:release factor glutamine methyltransferase